ncbi:ChaB family protein [Rhodococcoides kroppenstedtii]|uniref:ChaB family protein n=1 Tax=Rhodococcoides kroppenstedtii TaxID=293050 RepID=UPI001BDE76AB|nr:ChaB family protein [Rhodococcus kroppenstedtii]MBT1193165.1 ChaB family protein [Rhodococcus kroppenstedtii]
MPATDDDGNAKESELPSTLQKSDDKAQRTYAKALDSAEEQYDDEARAHRVAYAALKHTHEKVGDHWEEKDDYGPSDERAKSGGPNPSGESKEGVYANASKKHLEDVAKKLDVTGRSRMNKDELVDAIEKENRRQTDRNR